MRVFDPLYGAFHLPPDLSDLAMAPEVRRLSQIRLLNTLTPSLGVLGELRRYSHTLGVLRLALDTPMPFFTKEEKRAFLASVLLHDIGTPPFGHLLEYHLRDRTGTWSHESLIKSLLWKLGAPENAAHQIFGGRQLEAMNILRRTGVNTKIVHEIIGEKHPLSTLLFGSIDLDNLDNVARMAWALGLSGGPEIAISLASGLHVSRSGNLLLEEQRFYPDVVRWAHLRRAVYEIIVFDAPTVAAQAVLSEALRLALDSGTLSNTHWDLYDESLVERLRADSLTKSLITSYYLGRLPQLAICVQVFVNVKQNRISREKLEELTKLSLAREFQADRIFAYVFIDRGAFGKQLTFVDPRTGSEWSIGSTSSSLVLYGFVSSQECPSRARCARATENLVKQIHFDGEWSWKTLRQAEAQTESDERQITLPFAVA